MLRYGWIAALLVVGGCKSPDSLLPYPLAVTAEGIGPVHIGESFNIPMLRGKLPGFDLEKLSEVTSANGQTILRLKRHESPIALVISDPKGEVIDEVVVLSPLVKDSHGAGINDILKASGHLRCIQEICRDSDIPSITYRIRPDTQTIREITVQRL